MPQPSPFTKEQIAYWEAHRDETEQPSLIATIVTCWFFPFLAVALRMQCRRIKRAPVQADDWFIILALAPLSVLLIGFSISVQAGSGLHIIFASDLTLYLKMKVLMQPSSALIACCTKISIMLLYLRIFKSRSLKISCIITGVIVVLWTIASVVITFTQCIPLDLFWTDPSSDGCFNPAVPYTTFASLNLVTDVVLFILPIRHVWRLQMSRAMKLQVLATFALGGIVCIFGVMRILNVSKASGQVDVTYESADAPIWVTVEAAVGIVCACLPTFRPLVGGLWKKPDRSQVYSSDYLVSGRSRDRSHAQRLPSDIELKQAGWSDDITEAHPRPDTESSGDYHAR